MWVHRRFVLDLSANDLRMLRALVRGLRCHPRHGVAGGVAGVFNLSTVVALCLHTGMRVLVMELEKSLETPLDVGSAHEASPRAPGNPSRA